MNSDPNEFQTLRKLMALKRHEQPPPAYLNGLSERIMNRIEEGDCPLTLWERISTNVATRPGVAYAVGLTVCGALGVGSFYIARQEASDSNGNTVAVTFPNPAPPTAFASQLKPVGSTLHVANWLGNTNPSSGNEPQISLFDTVHAAVPVSYVRAGN